MNEAVNDAAAKTEMYPLSDVDEGEVDAVPPLLPQPATNTPATISNETRLRIATPSSAAWQLDDDVGCLHGRDSHDTRLQPKLVD